MKKLLTLTLASALLLTSLTSCRLPEKKDPFKEILEGNPEIELPKSEIMEVDPESIPQYEVHDVIKDYDSEECIETDDGQIVVKYKICKYETQNVAVVSIENRSEQALTLSIKGICQDTLQGKSKTISRTFYGFAAGWQNYFVFPAQMEFDEFSYQLDYEPYEGETYGQYLTNLGWADIGLAHWRFEAPGRTMLMMVWLYDWIAKQPCNYAAHYVLFDKNGEILVLDMEDVTHMAQQDQNHLGEDLGGIDARSMLSYMLEIDPAADFNKLGFTYNNSFGANCAYYPAKDAYQSSGYQLPEKYRNSYGIVCFTGLWDDEAPKSQIPPFQSLYQSY